MDEAYELMDHSNREARFALIVMGILNAFVVISASRPEVVGSLDTTQRMVAAVLSASTPWPRCTSCIRRSRRCNPGKFRPKLEDWDARRHAADGRALL